MGGWDAGDFVFSDGTTTPPADITPPVEKLNQLSDEVKMLGYTLFAVSFAIGLLFAIWTIINFNTRIVRASQPQFLLLIIFGCWVSSATIFPIAVDDSSVLEEGPNLMSYADWDEDEQREEFSQMDFMCMLTPFLYCIGFAITFSSLFSKIIRVLRIFGVSGGSTTLKKTRVKVKDMIIYQIVGICIEALICLIWVVTDDAKPIWVRTTKCITWEENSEGETTDECAVFSEDVYGNPLESEGRCSAKDPDAAWPFLIAIMVIHSLCSCTRLCSATRLATCPPSSKRANGSTWRWSRTSRSSSSAFRSSSWLPITRRCSTSCDAPSSSSTTLESSASSSFRRCTPSTSVPTTSRPPR